MKGTSASASTSDTTYANVNVSLSRLFAQPEPDICVCGCQYGGCVPQRRYAAPKTDPISDSERGALITFSVNGKCGFSVRSALEKQYAGLDGRDDHMFVGFRSAVAIRFEWKAYEKWTHQIRTLNYRNPPGNINRSKLATELAKRVQWFSKKVEGAVPEPIWENYCFRRGVVDADHLQLVALERVSQSSWILHLRLIPSSIPPPSS